MSYNQTDFVKDRVAVEASSANRLRGSRFVRETPEFLRVGIIDVGIEILPVERNLRDMSSGVPYYERDLLNVIRQGRGVPAVPLVSGYSALKREKGASDKPDDKLSKDAPGILWSVPGGRRLAGLRRWLLLARRGLGVALQERNRHRGNDQRHQHEE